MLGMHVMRTKEGRKDIHAALVKYAPVAPTDVVCDFACSTKPYLMTREPHLFRRTRFWLDQFHKNPHKCLPYYDPDDYYALELFNTSMQEQWHVTSDLLHVAAHQMSLESTCFLMQLLR